MKRFQFFRTGLLLLLICFFLSSCFDLREEITIHKNGSGSYTQILDMSNNPMIAMAKAMEKNDSTGAIKKGDISLSEKTDSAFMARKEYAQSVKGIKNVKVFADRENYATKLSFDFDNIDALNEAISNETDGLKTFFTFQKRQLTKTGALAFSFNSAKEKKNKQTPEQMESSKKLLKAFFKNSNYELVVHVPNKVKSYTNQSRAFLSDDKKTIKIKVPLLEILEQAEENKSASPLATKIKFK